MYGKGANNQPLRQRNSNLRMEARCSNTKTKESNCHPPHPPPALAQVSQRAANIKSKTLMPMGAAKGEAKQRQQQQQLEKPNTQV